MLLSEERLSGLIDKIYDAALQPGNWGAVICEIGGAIGASSGTSLWFNRSGLELIRADIWNVPDEALQDYQRHYLAFCPRYRASRVLQAGTVYSDCVERASPNSYVREYYDFMDRHDLGIALIALAEKREDLTIGVNFYRDSRQEFDDDATAILAALMPHLRRATNLTARYSDILERADFGDAMFEASSATLVLDRLGRTVRINRAAETVLARQDGLAMVNGFLVAATSTDNYVLHQEIGRAVRPHVVGTTKTGDPVLINRPSGCTPYVVSVTPLRPQEKFRGHAALMTISEPSSPLRLRHTAAAFHLTPAEGLVAALLCAGHRPEHIAAVRNTSVQTVRSQIKSIYAKLGVRSQIEMIAKLTAT